MNHARNTRIWGLALVAMLAFSAMAAASASGAEPEVKAAKFPVPFTSTSGKGTLETKGGSKVTCESDTNKGEILDKAGNSKVTVTFKKCTTKVLGITVSCTSSGQETGTIVTKPLKDRIRYINHTTKEVGDVLSPETGELLAEFTCAGVTIKVRGSVIGKIPAGKFEEPESSGSLEFKQSGGVQNPREYEEEVGGVFKKVVAHLETSTGGGAFEESGEETTDTITFAEAIQITRP